MLVLRSLLFNAAFYVNVVLWGVIATPTLVLRRRAVLRVAQGWGLTSMWLLRVLAGTRVEFRNFDRVPAGGVLVASKHQSAFETFALLAAFDDPAIILKRELLWIPFFGWHAWRAGMIPVDRKAGSRALAGMTNRAEREVARGRQLLIFPEGTRRAPAAEPAYKFGAMHLYSSLGVPCVPVALNSGLFWPRRSFLRHPGTIVVECLEPIPPGLSRHRFFAEMQSRIETATARLLDEGRGALTARTRETVEASSA